MLVYSAFQRHEEKKRDESMKVCARCDKELPKSLKFCSKCGGADFLTIPEFLEVEATRRQDYRDALSAKQTRNDLILAIHSLSAATYCSSCRTYYEKAGVYKDGVPDFCPECGRNIAGEHMSPESIFRLLQPNYATLLTSFEAFKSLKKESPEPLVSLKLGWSRLSEAGRQYWRWNTFSRHSNLPSTPRWVTRLSIALLVGALAVGVLVGSISIYRSEKELDKELAKPTTAVSTEPERTRRLAPEGIVYNLVRISGRIKGGLIGIAPGTELKVISKNSDGSLHVAAGNLGEADIPASAVTNDLDVADAARNAQ